MSSHDFHQLSPLDFEELVRDLLQCEFKIRLESFGPGRDGGIDFRFARGALTTIVQAKHYSGSPSSALIRSAKSEDEKVKRLKPQRYILATSQSLTPNQKDQLIAAMPNAPLAKEDVLGREDLNNLLGLHPAVLRKHFKLWLTDVNTLERIIHSGVYNRTDAELDIIKRLVPRFVHNNSIAQAEEILERRGALIIAGEPGVGKTTLARALTWLHLEQGWKVFVVDDLKEAMTVCTEGEKRLVVFDDFLGQISLTNDALREVDQRLPIFLDRVKNSKTLRFILTTRSYLIRQAQLQSTRLGSAEMKAAELLLRVGEYTRRIRAQIVFNHLFFSKLSLEERDSLLAKDFYLKMVDHANFSPRLIELLTSPDYHMHQSTPIRDVVIRVLNSPSELWAIPFRSHLSEDSRALLLQLFFLGSMVRMEDALRSFARSIPARPEGISGDAPISRFKRALKPLEGSLLYITGDYIMFANPGVRDFLSEVVLEDRLLLSVVNVVDTCDELDEAWSFFVKHRDQLNESALNASLWVDCLSRCLRDDVASRLEAVSIGLQMGAFFGDGCTLALEFVESVLMSMEARPYETEREHLYRHAVEHYGALSRYQQLLVPSIKILVQHLTAMLEECGDQLTLDEISMIFGTVDESGESDGLHQAATETALRDYVRDLSDKVFEISSVGELDDYEAKLSSMLGRHKIGFSYVQKQLFERHRESLENEISRAEEAYSASSHIQREPEVSDAELKSLFATLRRPS